MLSDFLKRNITSQAAYIQANGYGYGQVEPNHLSAQATKEVYAQLPAQKDIEILENGQFAKYDYLNKVVDFDGVIIQRHQLGKPHTAIQEQRDDAVISLTVRTVYTGQQPLRLFDSQVFRQAFFQFGGVEVDHGVVVDHVVHFQVFEKGTDRRRFSCPGFFFVIAIVFAI